MNLDLSPEMKAELENTRAVLVNMFTARAHGAPPASCEGDGAQDAVGSLPLDAGAVTGGMEAFPFAQDYRVPISGTVQTSLLLPASLASVDAAVRAADQHGGFVVCMDVRTAQQSELEAMAGDAVDVTWPDGGMRRCKLRFSFL